MKKNPKQKKPAPQKPAQKVAVPKERPRRRTVTIALLAILGVAVVVRVVYLVQLQRSELSDFLMLDSKLYYSVARMVATGGELPAIAITFNPFYPAFLVAVFKVFGVGLLAPRVLQLTLGMVTIILVAAAAGRLSPRGNKGQSGEGTSKSVVTIAATAMAVLYSSFVLYDGMILASTFEVFFLTAALLVALAWDRSLGDNNALAVGSKPVPWWGAPLVLGALCGAGAAARPNLFLLLLAALPVWMFLRHRVLDKGPKTPSAKWIRAGLKAAVVFLAAGALFLAPTVAWNAKQTGQITPGGSHGGFNFYVGNGPGATGVFSAPPGVRGDVLTLFEDLKVQAETEASRLMTQEEVSRYYFKKTLDHIAAHPGEWIGIMGKKLMLFFGSASDDMPTTYFHRRECGVLDFLFVPFAVIAPLGICGLIVLLGGRRHRAVMSIFLACGVLSVVLFFVNVRFRLPAVPVLILLAAFFVDWIRREAARRRFAGIAVMGALALGVFFFVSVRPGPTISEGAAYDVLGIHYAESDQPDKAAEAFANAYRLDPNRVQTAINYARSLARRGQYGESADVYARAYSNTPRYPRLGIEYGVVLVRLEQYDDARRLFVEGTTFGLPRDRALAMRFLIERAVEEDDTDEAILWVKAILDLFPGEPDMTELLDLLENPPPEGD